MKAVIVLSQPPLIEGGAPGRCAVSLLRGLRQNGVEVDAHAARQHFAIAGEVPADLGVTSHDVAPQRSGIASIGRRLRRPNGDLCRPDFLDQIAAAAASADVVHLEDIESAWSDLRVHVPSLLHVHYRSRLDRDLGQPWEPRFRHVAEFALAEWRGARRHHWLVANSPVVAATLRRDNPRAEVTVVPLSLDPADYPVATPPDGLVVGVIGTAGWATTRAAMERLVESVWPLVHAAVPQAVLRIAGRGTDQLRSAGSRVGIETVGEVASAAEFIRGLSLLLFPLTRGSGMKVKVLESLASGVPVVTTSRGAEGIAANDGMILAETDAALAASTIRLLTEEVERHQRAAAARATYERLYTPIVATSPLVALYERMAAGR